MAQGVFPFKHENEKQKSHMTVYGGLPLYLDLAHVMGLRESVEKHFGIRRNSHGLRDSEIVMSLILLNLSGGDCVEDLNRFESDDGFCRILDRIQMHGMSRMNAGPLDGVGAKKSGDPYRHRHLCSGICQPFMILSLNLNAAMKRLVLGRSWVPRRMKAIRFYLINLPARIMERSREVLVRVSNESYFKWFVTLRARISVLGFVSSG